MVDFDSLVDDSAAQAPSQVSAPVQPDAQPQSPSTSSFDDMVDDGQQTNLKFDDLQDDQDKYGTGEQQVKAGLEGAAEGLLSKPVSVWAEQHLLGVDPDAIVGRENANPTTHALGEAAGISTGLLTGTGEAWAVGKVLEAIPLLNEASQAGALARVGTGMLRGAIQSASFQTGDEIGDAMLGKGDPNAPVSSALAHIGAAALLGGAAGSAQGLFDFGINKGAQLLNKVSQGDANSFLAGIGSGAIPKMKINLASLASGDEEFSQSAFNAGAKVHEFLTGKALRFGEDAIAYHELRDKFPDGVLGDAAAALAADQLNQRLINPGLKVGLKQVNKRIVVPAVLHALGSGETDINPIIQWSNSISKGAKRINDGIDSLFKGTGGAAVELYASERNKQKLKEAIASGKLNQQLQDQSSQGVQSTQSSLPQSPTQVGAFAEGGMAMNNGPDDSGADSRTMNINTAYPIPDRFAMNSSPKDSIPQNELKSTNAVQKHWPEQATLLGAAKSRVNNYLNSVRPQPNQPKLPFDSAPTQTEANREYDKAIDIAVEPLSVLNHIKAGTLTPDHMKHMQGMWPEVTEHLKKKMTEKITQAQIDGEKPNYRVRQMMSMFMDTPLDGTLTPQNMMAAQSVYAPQPGSQQPPNPPVKKNKKGTATLTKAADQYQTTTQAAEARQKE